jgi:hypothetical protein
MISIVRSRIGRVVALPGLVLTLVVGVGVQAAGASTSQVCGNGGTGYCLNDWGGGGASGDAVKMYYGGTANDDFYVQEVNRCSGQDTVQSVYYHDSTNCPFGNTGLDQQFWGDPIVQITYTNNESQCVGSTSSDYAVLASCANPISGSGGGTGVIMVTVEAPCSSHTDFAFADRYASDQHGRAYWLTSGGNVGVQAYYGSSNVSCWNGFQYFAP